MLIKEDYIWALVCALMIFLILVFREYLTAVIVFLVFAAGFLNYYDPSRKR